MFDLGDPVPLGIDVTDSAGAPANATTVALTITLPDGTTVTPTVTNPPAVTGSYTYDYATVQAGRHTVRWVTTNPAGAYTDSFDVDEAAPSGIVSLAEAKEHLNITTTASDEELRLFIDAASEWVEHHVGVVVRRTVTEIQSPTRDGFVQLNNPAIALTTLTSVYGGSTSYVAATVTADSPELAVGKLWLGTSSYTSAYPLAVTYVAGRAVVPALLRTAALNYLKWDWLSQRGAAPTPLDVAEEFASVPGTVPYKIAQKLAPYALMVVA